MRTWDAHSLICQQGTLCRPVMFIKRCNQESNHWKSQLYDLYADVFTIQLDLQTARKFYHSCAVCSVQSVLRDKERGLLILVHVE